MLKKTERNIVKMMYFDFNEREITKTIRYLNGSIRCLKQGYCRPALMLVDSLYEISSEAIKLADKKQDYEVTQGCVPLLYEFLELCKEYKKEADERNATEAEKTLIKIRDNFSRMLNFDKLLKSTKGDPGKLQRIAQSIIG